jgi:hypothetical protein
MDQQLRKQIFDLLLGLPQGADLNDPAERALDKMTGDLLGKIERLVDAHYDNRIMEAGVVLLHEFKTALRVCMAQRGHHGFLDEYLPGGCFHGDTLKAEGRKS